MQKISIIIPLYVICDRFFRNLNYFSNLIYPDYEILIVCDEKVEVNINKVRLILTGLKQTSPAEKRDIALKEANGDILAFIDDDAYPDKYWLKNAIGYFKGSEVGAVGGPGLTPPNDSFMQKAGGAVYESILGSGGLQYRFIPKEKKEVDDYPAYNLLIKKDLLKKIGGFNSKFYGGEDTKVCLNIIKAGKKIIYAPNVLVYHHRRSLFKNHLRQVNNVGLHRGYFVKAFPETSLKLKYFFPSIAGIVFFLGVILSFKYRLVFIFLNSGIAFSLLLGFVSVVYRQKNILIAIVASVGIILHHLAYGYGFLKGLFIKELHR